VAPRVRIVTFGQRDLFVRAPYISAAIAVAGAEKTTIRLRAMRNGVEISNSIVTLGRDLSARVPVDAYVAQFPASASGIYTLSAEATMPGGGAVDTVTLRSFPTAEESITVANSSQLKAALIAGRSSASSHIRIRMHSGEYSMPQETDVDRAYFDTTTIPTKLFTFERATASSNPIVVDSFVAASNTIWKNIGFIGRAGGYMLRFTLGGTHVFTSCSFVGLGTNVSVFAVPFETAIRLDDCYMSDMTNGIAGAQVVRGMFWRNVEGSVFRNIRRVLEGTTGYRGVPTYTDADAVDRISGSWLDIDDPASQVFVRCNMVPDDYRPIIQTVRHNVMQDAAFIGNAWATLSTTGLRFGSVVNTFFANNTVASNSSGVSIAAYGQHVQDNVGKNNYFTALTKDSSRFFVANWTYNATSSSTKQGATNMSDVPVPFLNKYMVLRSDSPLRDGGSPEPAIVTSFGYLPLDTTIGAVPYQDDRLMDSTLASVITLSDLGVSLKDSDTGDFVGVDSGGGDGGAFLHVDGTQSGLLATL